MSQRKYVLLLNWSQQGISYLYALGLYNYIRVFEGTYMYKAQFRRRSFHEPNLIRIWVDIPPFDSYAVLIQPNLIQLKQIKCASQLFSAQLLDKFIQKTL